MIAQQNINQTVRAVAQHFADISLRDRARLLRLSVEWAHMNQIRWREALDGLDLTLNHCRTSPRLDARTATGGAVMIKLEGIRLHYLRSERGWSATLDIDVPERVLNR